MLIRWKYKHVTQRTNNSIASKNKRNIIIHERGLRDHSYLTLFKTVVVNVKWQYSVGVLIVIIERPKSLATMDIIELEWFWKSHFLLVTEVEKGQKILTVAINIIY